VGGGVRWAWWRGGGLGGRRWRGRGCRWGRVWGAGSARFRGGVWGVRERVLGCG